MGEKKEKLKSKVMCKREIWREHRLSQLRSVYQNESYTQKTTHWHQQQHFLSLSLWEFAHQACTHYSEIRTIHNYYKSVYNIFTYFIYYFKYKYYTQIKMLGSEKIVIVCVWAN